jgi:hypothetical protein
VGIQSFSRSFRFIKGLPGKRKLRTHQSDPASPRVAESRPPLNDEDAEDPLFTDSFSGNNAGSAENADIAGNGRLLRIAE